MERFNPKIPRDSSSGTSTRKPPRRRSSETCSRAETLLLYRVQCVNIPRGLRQSRIQLPICASSATIYSSMSINYFNNPFDITFRNKFLPNIAIDIKGSIHYSFNKSVLIEYMWGFIRAQYSVSTDDLQVDASYSGKNKCKN